MKEPLSEEKSVAQPLLASSFQNRNAAVLAQFQQPGRHQTYPLLHTIRIFIKLIASKEQ
jgi:hypothetical protein